MLGDLPDTFNDAKVSYNFMNGLLVKNTHDITIMCEPKVFRVLTEKKSKPVENMFAFAVDFINNENFSKKIKNSGKKSLNHRPTTKTRKTGMRSRPSTTNSRRASNFAT